MIDFHTHCLPEIDDGSDSIESSLAMLRESLNNGIDTVVATPHFYYGEQTVEEFLEQRDAALARLREACAREHLPIRIIPAAEVLVREGISKIDLRPLCIEGTSCVMLELPFMTPPMWLFEEIENIVFDQDLTVMYAHIDRYRNWYSPVDVAEITDIPGLFLQVSASSLSRRYSYLALQKWIPAVKRVVLGTDMHAPKTTNKDMNRAYACLRRVGVGRDWLGYIEQCEDTFMQSWE